MKTTKTAL